MRGRRENPKSGDVSEDRAKINLDESFHNLPYTEEELITILQRGEHPSNINQGRIRDTLVRGIPETLRGELWVYISKSTYLRESYDEGYYRSLLAGSVEETERKIEKDLDRTYPDSPEYQTQGSNLSQKLFNVLRAYAVYDKKVGYVQGMNFIAGLLLLYIPGEEYAFWVFLHIMKEKRWRYAFLPGMPKIHSMLSSLSNQIEKRFPDVHAHCTFNGITPSEPFSPFLLSIFSTSCPLEMSVRVMDLFLFDGDHVLFVMIMRMLQVKRSTALGVAGVDLFQYLRSTLTKECCEEYDIGFLVTPVVTMLRSEWVKKTS